MPTLDVIEVVDPLVEAEAELELREQARKKVEEDRKELIQRWNNRLEHARKHDQHIRKRYADDRRVARGDTEWLVDTNLVNAILEILMAFVYAKDPDISVTVAPSVGKSRSRELAEVTETLQIVVSRLLKDAGLKRKAKRMVRSAMTVGVGWLKATMQTRTERDPMIEAQLNDLRQNLDRVTALKAELAAGEAGSEGATRQEIEDNITALEAKLERQVTIGLALDFFVADDVLVSPECGELVNYVDAPWISFRFYKPKEEVKALTGWDDSKLQHANLYHQRQRNGDESGPGAASGDKSTEWIRATDQDAETVEGFLAVEEIHSKRDGVVYTLVDGCGEYWAREPFAPRQSSRFYDCFLLGFHWIDGDRHPQSDVYQLKRLQDEYGRTRSNFAEHRKRSIPATVVDGSAIPPAELDKIKNSQLGEWVAINQAVPGEDLRKAFAPKSYAQFDPMLYNTQPIMTDIEKVSGAQDAMQSGVQVEKTATEAEIQNNGFGARIGTRKDELEDVFTELAQHVAELAMQTLDSEFVTRLAGINAVWPKLSIDEIHYGFNIAVKAGSTGKPNTAAQRAAWSTLLPLIEKIITVVGNFRSQGPQMEWAAQPYIELLRETVNRLDDNFDIERLLPVPPAVAPPTLGPDGQPLPPMAPALGNAPGGVPGLPAAP